MAVDTNVLVRILVDDPGQPAQVAAARNFARKAEQVFVAQIVQVELVWVLESAYKLGKETVLMVLEQLLRNEGFQLQEEEGFMHALGLFRDSSADFSDCLIATQAARYGEGLMTFDKKLARLDGVGLLG